MTVDVGKIWSQKRLTSGHQQIQTASLGDLINDRQPFLRTQFSGRVSGRSQIAMHTAKVAAAGQANASGKRDTRSSILRPSFHDRPYYKKQVFPNNPLCHLADQGCLQQITDKTIEVYRRLIGFDFKTCQRPCRYLRNSWSRPTASRENPPPCRGKKPFISSMFPRIGTRMISSAISRRTIFSLFTNILSWFITLTTSQLFHCFNTFPSSVCTAYLVFFQPQNRLFTPVDTIIFSVI